MVTKSIPAPFTVEAAWWALSGEAVSIRGAGRGVVDNRTRNRKVTVSGGEVMSEVPASAATDEDLVRRFQRGVDREGALLELFDRYGAITQAFLRRRIGSGDIAAELNQDLYIAVLEGLDRFRGDSSFKTWLFRMAQNRLSNLRRRWRTHLDELPDATPDELMEELVASDAPTPDVEFGRGEVNQALERCLANLPEIERAVVVGQYYEGSALEQLTQQFQMTNKSGARASLIAAQRKLRRCLEQSGITQAE